MLTIGSVALKLHNLNWRESKDFDYLATEQEVKWFEESYKDKIIHSKEKKWGKTYFVLGHKPIEIEIATPGSNSEELLHLVEKSGWWSSNFDGVKWVQPEVVYWMKMSHRFLKNSPHFKKCMDDIIQLRKNHCDGKLIDIPEWNSWYKRRQKETYDYKHPSLKQEKDNFFANDGVNYIYDHDTIHESVKHLAEPAFFYIKADTTTVFCSKEKFFEASKLIQLYTVLEETYVLALERSQIPHNFEINRKKSFEIALMKVCTSITSGWWREFAWEHYYEVMEMYNEHYVDWFHYANSIGKIKPYKE